MGILVFVFHPSTSSIEHPDLCSASKKGSTTKFPLTVIRLESALSAWHPIIRAEWTLKIAVGDLVGRMI